MGVIQTFAPYAKAVVAVCGAIAVTAAALADGQVSNEEIVAISAAWTTAYGVWRVANVPGVVE